jgi:hypothetical protein
VLVFRDISERKRAENRTAVLHRITEAFTEAITPEEVAERFMRQGVEVMGVQTGAVFLLARVNSPHHADGLDRRGQDRREHLDTGQTQLSRTLPEFGESDG